MKDRDKTKEQCIEELQELRRRISELENSEGRLKQAEQALRESELRYREFFSTSQDCVFISSLDGHWLDCNESSLGLFGYDSRQDLLDTPIFQFYADPEDRATLLDLAQQQGFVKEFPVKLKRKSGDVFDSLITISCIRNADGSFKRFAGTIHDVSERKRAEQALFRSKEDLEIKVLERTAKLQVANDQLQLELAERKKAEVALELEREQLLSIFDSIGEVISVIDVETYEILYVNKFMRDRHGKDLVGGLCYKELHGNDSPCAHCSKEIAISLRGQPYRSDFHNPDVNRDYFGTDRIIRWSNGRIAKFHLGIDVTDLRITQEALRESEEKYRSVVENMQDVFYRTDREGMITMASPSVLQVLGYDSLDQIIGFKFAKDFYANPADRDRLLAEIQAKGSVRNFEVELVTQDGESVTVLTNSHIYYDKSGQPSGIEGVFTDITARKRAEKALRESEEKYRILVDTAQEAITVHQDGMRKFVNPAAARIWERSEEVLLSRPIAEFIHPDDREMVMGRALRRLRGEKPPSRYPYRIMTEDGRVKWVELSSTLFSWEGKPALLVLLTDITDRKHAEEELLKAKQDLEIKVLERTADLLKANEQLQLELSERKKVDEALREGEQRYRRLFEEAPIMYVISKVEGGAPIIKDCNDRFLDSLDYLREDVLGKSAADFCTPESRSEVLERGGYARALAGEYFIGERQLVRRDGTIIPTLLYTVPEKDSSGQVLGARCMYVDITARKKAEAELQRSNSILRAIIEAAPTAIMGLDLDGNVQTVWNPAAEKMLGWTAAEVMGKMFPCVPPESQEEFRSIRELARKGMPVEGREVRRRRKDGTFINYSVYSSPWHDSEGRTTGYISVLVDMTERKLAEEALRQSEAFYRGLYENIAEGIFIIDVTPDRGFQFVSFNPAQERAMELTTARIAGQTIDDVLPKEVAENLNNRCRMCVEERRVIHYEEVLDLPKGKFSFHTSLAPIEGPDGAITRIIGIARDVTEPKNLQNQLAHAQKMKALGTLAGGIAHDFNNLLQAVIGCTDVLNMREYLHEGDRKKVQMIRQAAGDGADLVSRILTFSRKGESKVRPIDLNREILRIEPLVCRTLTKLVEVRLILSDDLDVIDADPTQIDQVVLNLAVNASQAMPDGGQLLIETSNITITSDYLRTHIEARPGKYVLLMISDTGIGMSREVVERIFEPFFTTKTDGEGTGLGLATVHGIVAQHKGYIRCYSEPGVGTSFKIYFPVSSASIVPDVAATGQMPASGTETILLVDDDDRLREMGSEMLSLMGYKVLNAGNGEDALNIYARHADKISLIVLDWIMPGMGGKRCLEEILRMNPGAKVIIASGYSSNGIAIGEQQTRASGFLRKPYDAKDILIEIRKVLDREL